MGIDDRGDRGADDGEATADPGEEDPGEEDPGEEDPGVLDSGVLDSGKEDSCEEDPVPADPADPVRSANATGIAPIADPTPNATANAPTRPM